LLYRFRIQPWHRPGLLIGFGVLPRNAYAELTDTQLFIRFGWFAATTPIKNIARWEISGPYRFYRAIGVRGTVGKPDLTFGSSTHGGICLVLHRPVALQPIGGRLRRLYLTLDELEAFAADLESRGIHGTDVRNEPSDQPI
jgi:hypothetical protein